MNKWLAIFLVFSLSACISDSNTKEDSQSPEELHGSWRLDSETSESYINITKDNLVFFNHHKAHHCHTKIQHNFITENDNRITIESNDGASNVFSWSIQGSKLSFRDSNGVNSYLTRSFDNPELAVSCPNTVDQGIIDISISFQKLPASIPSEHYFNLYLIFDLNGNNVKDKGDITFLFIKFRDDDTTDINNLRAYSRIFIEKVSDHIDNEIYLADTDYSIENNTITFQVKKSDRTEFSGIDTNARIYLSTTYSDQSNTYLSDYYPSYNEFTPHGIDASNLLDNSDDVYRPMPESITMDLKAISIQFIDQPPLPIGL
ncbi:MAG: hypothetical protein JXR16_01800 [Bermanella sp.]